MEVPRRKPVPAKLDAQSATPPLVPDVMRIVRLQETESLSYTRPTNRHFPKDRGLLIDHTRSASNNHSTERKEVKPSSDRWQRSRRDGYFNFKGPKGAAHVKMEEVHGVDVSWIHRPRDGKPLPPKQPPTSGKDLTSQPEKRPNPPTVTPVPDPQQETAPAAPATPDPAPAVNGPPKSQVRRPGLGGRTSSAEKTTSRKASWISNISSKFSSSQTTPERPSPQPTHPTRQTPPSAASTPNINGTPSPLPAHREDVEEAEPYIPSKPREGSFFSSLTRRLSSASTNNVPRVQGSGGMCERRVLNVDPNRERCLIPEMDPSRLRKVSFCVDVEIAGGPRYVDDEEEQDRSQKRKSVKLKERAEGEALKRPQAVQDEKDEKGEVKLDAKSRNIDIPNDKETQDDGEDGSGSLPTGNLEDDQDHTSRKKEKKKRSEEERKERKEKRKRKAEESGAIPVELKPGEDASVPRSSSPSPQSTMDTPPPVGDKSLPSPEYPQPSNPPNPATKQDRPTTDPVRIYRRCCQLRETPILKRITEQLMAPTCCAPFEPGVVSCLDLSGSRLQLADVVTLGDWLAVVPVKQLRLEDADINDEGVRHILAGLIAAKRPQPTRRKNVAPRHRERIAPKVYQERAGIVEKITLKNNPRITRLGWKHINLFVYMCRSLRAIDLSMNQFPDTLPPGSHVNQVKAPQNVPKGTAQDIDAGEILYKCLCERPGGSRLEELIVSECGLSGRQIKMIVNGAIACGISRLGLAGNHLDDDGLAHIMHYLRSGVCQGLDIGGNDLHGKVRALAEAVQQKNNLPCWGLSLAGCNLHTSDLKELFAALVKLPDFRFIDLSHNRDLCTRDNSAISLFRRYMSQFKQLKRIHLADVGMGPKQAIALADCLPDGPRLAHLNILDNPQLSALANAKDEVNQEEACALYASLMAAVRVSSTLICIDIDVPSAENSEVVKALARQVVAYSLRNMEQFAIAEATGAIPTANATAQLTQPHGGEKRIKEVTVPDVLWHLVGHVDGNTENHDNDDPAPDDDYIVGGTGVVKALQYVLGEKANDEFRRTSLPTTPISGSVTPRDRPDSSAGLTAEEQRGKAKKMSKNLLDSARKIRVRLQPALVKEATAGDELAYRRLCFLDQTLQNMIQRFEEEYPETRVAPPSPREAASTSSSLTGQSNSRTNNSLTTQATEFTGNASDEDDLDEGGAVRPAVRRHNSEISLSGRALSMEEGQLHRLGQQLRREVIDSPTTATPPTSAWHNEEQRLKELGEKLEAISGPQLRKMVEHEGWENVLSKVGGNYDDLRRLQEQDPEGYEQFKESQMKARMNLDRDRPASRGNV